MNWNLFTILMTFFVIASNALWYSIKYIVSQNGYETHLFWGHFNDVANLHRLINKEQDVNLKRKYKIVLLAFYSVIALLIVGFIMTAFLRDQ